MCVCVCEKIGAKVVKLKHCQRNQFFLIFGVSDSIYLIFPLLFHILSDLPNLPFIRVYIYIYIYRLFVFYIELIPLVKV